MKTFPQVVAKLRKQGSPVMLFTNLWSLSVQVQDFSHLHCQLLRKQRENCERAGMQSVDESVFIPMDVVGAVNSMLNHVTTPPPQEAFITAASFFVIVGVNCA